MHKSAIVHIGGTVAYALSQWLIIAFASRFISLEIAGLYAYYLAFFTPAFILCSFGLRNSISSDSGRCYFDAEYKRARLLSVAVFFFFGASLLAVVTDSPVIGILVFLIKLIELYSEVIYGGWVRDRYAERYGISKLLRFGLFLVLLLIGSSFLGASEYVLYSYPAAQFVVLALYDCRKESLSREEFDLRKGVMRQLIRFSIPLAVGAFLISLNTAVPRVIVKELLGEQALALYVLGVYFISIAVIPVTSYAQIYIAVFSKKEDIDEALKSSQFKRLTIFSALYGVSFVLAMVLIARGFLEHVYGVVGEYGAVDLALIGVAGMGQFLMTVGNGLLVARRQFKLVMRISAFSLIVTVFLSYVMTSFFELRGAFFALAIGGTVLLLGVILGVMHTRRLERRFAAVK